MAFKLKHKGVPALMKSCSQMPLKKDPTKKNVATAADKAAYAKYKEAGGKLTMTQAKRVNFRTPGESKQKLAEAKARQTEKAVEERKKAEAKGLGTKFYADTQKDIYN